MILSSGLHASSQTAGQRLYSGPSASGRDVLPNPRDPGAPRTVPGAGLWLREPVARQADRWTPSYPVGKQIWQ